VRTLKSAKNKTNAEFKRELIDVNVSSDLIESLVESNWDKSRTILLDVKTMKSMASGTCIIPSDQKGTAVVVCKEEKKIKIFGLVLTEVQVWRELIDDAKKGCDDLVFQEACGEILSKASNVLAERQFRQLVAYASKKMQEEGAESKKAVTVGLPTA
jgi:hypothetical protein